MIVDTSAIIAILDKEPGFEKLADCLFDASGAKMAAPTLVELNAVISSRNDPKLWRQVERLLSLYRVKPEPFTEEQARIASQAYRDYGRGSGHPAHLNLGDCFSYALAFDTGEPLLYVGNDFSQTDIRAALEQP